MDNFHFDEMVWRSESGLVNQAMTEITAIKDDAEFEKQIFLIRIARQLSGLDQGKSCLIRQFFEKRLITGLFASLSRIYLIFCFCQMRFRFLKPVFVDTGSASPGQEIALVGRDHHERVAVIPNLGQLFYDFFRYWRPRMKNDLVCLGKLFVDSRYFHGLIVARRSIGKFIKTIPKRQQHQ
jgi:hypothetical protein